MKIILKISVIMLGIFILIEISLRMYQAFSPAFAIMPDDTYMRYRGKKNYLELNNFRLNSKGYKDVEYSIEKPGGTFRILFIGDSYVYGAVPYDDCFVTLIEAKLRKTCTNCEIINMGIPAALPVDYLSLFINEGIELNPDMVIVNITMSDDFKKGGKRFKIFSYSYTIKLINSIIANNVDHTGRVFASGKYDEDILIRSEKDYMKYLVETESGIFNRNNPKLKMNFYSTINLIKRIKHLSDQKSISFAVVVSPSELQVNPASQEKLYSILSTSSSDFDFKKPSRMIATDFNKKNIQYVDLLDDFILTYKRKKSRLYQKNDPHWNISGNRLGADIVYPWLKKLVSESMKK